MPHVFVTPTVDEGPMGGNWFFSRYTRKQGVTVYRLDGIFYEERFPVQDDLDQADLVYLGGHEHIVSDSEKIALESVGYEVIST